MLRLRDVMFHRKIQRETTFLQVPFSQIATVEGLEDFRNLEFLDLSNNLIERLPSLAHLTQLRVLDVSHNRLRELPALPPMLQQLKCAHNQLTHLQSILMTRQLQYIDAGFNCLSQLPSQYEGRLFFLDLRANQFRKKPQWAGFARTLLLEENPLEPDVDHEEEPASGNGESSNKEA
ncbi:MAG: leucine-rich repeat domain-containing protein [Acidobacteria bacterium]|nr:leucine-rich repeat domain-containing protein [Acidobacteriota bacterium]